MKNALALTAAALLAHSCFGYIRYGYNDPVAGFIPLTRPDTAAIQYYVNDQIKGGQTSNAIGAPVNVVKAGSDPVAAIRAALNTWNAVPNSKLKFLPLKTTSAVHSTSDYQMTVTFASTEDLSILGYSPGKTTGATAITATAWTTSKGKLSNGTDVVPGNIIDSDILLNSALTFSTDGSTPYDLQTVITHELGHALGADHSSLLGATMFPFSTVDTTALYNQRALSSDDLAFAGVGYGSTPVSVLSGKVTKADGAPVKAGLLTLIDRNSGSTVGGITGVDGTWSVTAPAGKYMIVVEPFNEIVGPANINSIDSAQVTLDFQATVLGSALTPSETTVTSGMNQTGLNITVNAATGVLKTPFIGMGAAGVTGDILNVVPPRLPLLVPSGKAIDIAVGSGGVDATTSIIVLGQGISVRAGSTRVDTKVTFGFGNLLRATLDIDARQTPTLATLMLVKGNNVLTYSGLIVVVPATPTFVSNGVVNAASFLGSNGDGVVSPGGLYAIFDLPDTPNLGPAAYAQPNGYDTYGLVPTTLAGVSVTFDGVPAPMFLSLNSQLNVQVPFEVAGKNSTQVQVSYNGSTSKPVKVTVVPSQPAFFNYTPGGKDSIAGNQDYSFNTLANPEARGKVVTIYGTGIGVSSYPVITGQGAPAPPAGYSGNSTCTLNNLKTFSVAFTGWTPTSVGLAQWSMVLPADAPVGTVTVVCTDPNGRSTPPGTLYIK